MTFSNLVMVRRFVERGFSVAEIVALTGRPGDEVRAAVEQCGTRTVLRGVAQRMLQQRVPRWWQRGEAAWRYCVEMNFADVLT